MSAPAYFSRCRRDAARAAVLASLVAGGWGSAAPLADPVVQAKDGPHCKELTSRSNDSLGPQRVGRGGVTIGDDGGKKDRSAATLGKTSQRFRGARARVGREAPPFQRTATALASPDTSGSKLCESFSAGLASLSSAADWMRRVRSWLQKPRQRLVLQILLPSHGLAPHLPPPGFQL